MALLAFLALALWLFPSLLAGQILYRRDINLVWLAQADGLMRIVTGGAWPLWDPYAGFGRPLLADPRAGILYPPTWLGLLVPPGPYYVASVILHLAGSAVGMYTLARRWSLSRIAALVVLALHPAEWWRDVRPLATVPGLLFEPDPGDGCPGHAAQDLRGGPGARGR